MITHHMGNGFTSPCGLEPASVYSGFQGGFSTDWADVDCAECQAEQPRRVGLGGVGTPAPLSKFYLTFGVKYPREPHPHWAGAHHDGWVTILAADEPQARATAALYFGQAWSMLYPDNHFPVALNQRKYYPLGEIAVLTAGNVVEGVGLPTPRFPVSDPRYHGHEDTDIVACRIEGRVKRQYKQFSSDSFKELGYDAMVVHPGCFQAAALRFATISEVDHAVQAGEMDWTEPSECDVCGVSIT